MSLPRFHAFCSPASPASFERRLLVVFARDFTPKHSAAISVAEPQKFCITDQKQLPGDDKLGQNSSKRVHTHDDRKTGTDALTFDYFFQREFELPH